MLSYDTPRVNGQAPPSPTNITTGRQAMVASTKALRPTGAALSSPVVPMGTSQSNGRNPGRQQADRPHHIWLVTGPAGCGKSTVAKYIARSLELPYIEGDEFHPKANIEKMSNGIPLTDADRWDWLTALREESLRQINAGKDGVVVTCSALKRKYRDVIRVAPYFSPNLHLHFIYLHAPKEVLFERVRARKNHYMGANMVTSQLEDLEEPTAQERDVISIDVSQPVDDVEEEALAQIHDAIAAESDE